MRLLVRMRMRSYITRLIKPGLFLTSLCFLLPDLVDKPLWILGAIPNGRNIGHTLLFVLLVSAAFTVKNRAYGVFALCGGLLHLLSDVGGFVPWLYPFKPYDFPHTAYRATVTLTNSIATLGQMAVADLAVLAAMGAVLGAIQWYGVRRQRVVEPAETDGQQ